MQFVLEILHHFLLEIVAFFTGKILVRVMCPSIKVESLDKIKSARTWKFKSKGFTYKKKNTKYLYVESVQAIGLLFFIIVMAVALAYKIYTT